MPLQLQTYISPRRVPDFRLHLRSCERFCKSFATLLPCREDGGGGGSTRNAAIRRGREGGLPRAGGLAPPRRFAPPPPPCGGGASERRGATACRRTYGDAWAFNRRREQARALN